LLAQGQVSEAALVEAQFREAWEQATGPLTIADL
jgi:hypothetical protein